MPSATVTVELHPMIAETGLWCAGCALPSAVRFVLVGLNPATLHTMFRQERTVCGQCEAVTS